MNRIIILIICLLTTNWVQAQQKVYAYRVSFKDKNGTLTFADSLQFLSQTALDRRSKQGISLDSTDLPIVQQYIDTTVVVSDAIAVHNKSKWFNQIVILTYDSSKIANILSLPIVQDVKLVAVSTLGNFKMKSNDEKKIDKFPIVETIEYKKTRGNPLFYGTAYQQIDMINGDCLHDMGYKGEGMKIAVLDVNFRRVDSCNAYSTLRQQARIKDSYDFARDTPFVYSMGVPSDHGMNVLGCMAAYEPGTYVGTAPNAEFYLYITEASAYEFPIEEDNWLSAAERADSIGVDMINSSLGYNKFDAPLDGSSYTYADMTGNKTLIAKAANMAVAKGIFVANAQGNEGAGAWHYLLTPADGDSVFSVGSVDGSGMWANSGYGPNASGQTKPDAVALGKAAMLIGGDCAPGASSGSSFATPILCGGIACLWQALPNFTTWQLRQIVRMSGSKYAALANGTDSSTVNTLGYGIPNLCKAFQIATNTSDIQNIDFTFALYPNPTEGVFTIKSFNVQQNFFSYTIMDMQGKIIKQSDKIYQNEFTSDALCNQPNGIYVLLLSTPDKIYSTKIVKQ